MKKSVLFTIVVLAFGFHLQSFADTHQSEAPVNSHAVPIDLFEVNGKIRQLPSYAIGKQDAQISEYCRKSEKGAVNLTGFKAVTNDYGQLRSILEVNKGTEIDSLVVVGPMNKDDLRLSGTVRYTAICRC